MWPDRVSNPGPLTYESGALPIALRGPNMHLDFWNCFRREKSITQLNYTKLINFLYIFGYKTGFSAL